MSVIRARYAVRSAALAWTCCALAWLAATGARAQHEAAIAAGVTAGTLSSAPPPAPGDGLPGRELEDWIDPATGTTTRTAIGCGVVVEGTLSATSAQSFATLTVLNGTRAPVTFLPSPTRARFGAGTYRRLTLPVHAHVRLDPGWMVTRTLAFPDKRMFKDQSALELEVRVLAGEAAQECVVPLRFERSAELPPSERTYLSYTTLEVEFGLGSRLLESGGLGELRGGSRVSLHLDFAGYFGPHHGMALSLVSDLYGSGAADRVLTRPTELRAPSVSGTGFLLGYIGRIYVAPWLTAAYHLATGPYIFELTDKLKDGPHRSTAVFPLRHRVRLGADFFTMEDGGRFGLAASFTHLFIPYGDFGAVELTGHAFSATVELLLGG